jgi:hypothetical protein
MKYQFIKELMMYARRVNGGTRKRKHKKVRTQRYRKN